MDLKKFFVCCSVLGSSLLTYSVFADEQMSQPPKNETNINSPVAPPIKSLSQFTITSDGTTLLVNGMTIDLPSTVSFAYNDPAGYDGNLTYSLNGGNEITESSIDCSNFPEGLTKIILKKYNSQDQSLFDSAIFYVNILRVKATVDIDKTINPSSATVGSDHPDWLFVNECW